MEYLSNWTDVSLVEMAGWSGSKSLTDSFLVFTATNGWRSFGWSLDDIVGKDISIEFDYIFTDVTNWTSVGVFIINLDSISYGSPLKQLEKTTEQWCHVKANISSAKKFIGINIRGDDGTGNSVTMKLANVRIHSNENKKSNINKNGVVKSNMFLETYAQNSAGGYSLHIGKTIFRQEKLSKAKLSKGGDLE